MLASRETQATNKIFLGEKYSENFEEHDFSVVHTIVLDDKVWQKISL